MRADDEEAVLLPVGRQLGHERVDVCALGQAVEVHDHRQRLVLIELVGGREQEPAVAVVEELLLLGHRLLGGPAAPCGGHGRSVGLLAGRCGRDDGGGRRLRCGGSAGSAGAGVRGGAAGAGREDHRGGQGERGEGERTWGAGHGASWSHRTDGGRGDGTGRSGLGLGIDGLGAVPARRRALLGTTRCRDRLGWRDEAEHTRTDGSCARGGRRRAARGHGAGR